MSFSNIAKKLALNQYPQEWDNWYDNTKSHEDTGLSLSALQDLQNRYSLFGTYYQDVVAGFEDLRRDALRSAWVYVACKHYMEHDMESCSKIPVPITDGTPAGDMAALFPLIVSVEDNIQSYYRRGFSDVEVNTYLDAYRGSIRATCSQTGRPGINPLYYRWTLYFAKAQMFPVGCFNFQIARVPNNVSVLQNVDTGKLIIALDQFLFHANGMPVDTNEDPNEPGNYNLRFDETDEDFLVHPIIDYRVQQERVAYSKKLWKKVIAPGDVVYSVHIPRGAVLTSENIEQSYILAQEIAWRAYPEYKIKGLYCSSWLLDPQLQQMLSEGSRINTFATGFTRYPVKSGTNQVFSTVFPNKPQDLSNLPEETSLQRKIKALYLSGGSIRCYDGFILYKS